MITISIGPADVHFVGKEIVRFHSIIWPAMLMSLGDAPAQEGLRPRLAAAGRRQDVQVQGQRRSDPYHPGRDATAWTPCASSCCATFPFGSRRQLLQRERSSSASTSTWPTTWATWSAAPLPWSASTSAAPCPQSRQADDEKDAELIALASGLQDKCYEEQMESLRLPERSGGHLQGHLPVPTSISTRTPPGCWPRTTEANGLAWPASCTTCWRLCASAPSC